jgi:putative hemolysin
MTACERAHPFRLNGSLRITRHGGLNRLLESTVEQAFSLARLDRMYQALPPVADCDAFLQQALDTFNIGVHCTDEALQRIPASGPLVVVANHPFGALEGVILAQQLRRVRPDVKILANFILERIPELRELFISVDPFGGDGAAGRNLRPLKQALTHLQQGGLLVIFPAGEVSHLHLRGGTIDPPWNNTVARLVRRTGAPVLPMYFPGSNSLMFQLAGLLHPRLRTALLPRELLNKRNRTIAVHVGTPLPFARLKTFDDDAMTAQLRLRCYALAAHDAGPAQPACLPGRAQEDIAAAVAAPLLCAEVEALPQEQLLDQSGEFQVWYARAGQMPWLLQEIGRLREITFRAAGEGTGSSRDIDLYDAYYLHLFIWDKEQRRVVGAYRLGLADEIARRFGVKGLYTHSLFRYRRHLLQQLGPAIELGRSFVRPEYQRSYSPLLLLWKGIGQFVARHPHYRTLFGPVSISGDYATQSQQLLVQFLRANNYLPQLARLVRPRRPFRAPLGPVWLRHNAPDDLEQLSELVSAMERDQKGVPVLLRQYLKLGGHILGFNVDEAFNNALDGLIMVDLRQTDPKVLAKYMGREQAAHFRVLHGAAPEAAGDDAAVR